MASKFCSDPMRSWGDMEKILAGVGEVVQIERPFLEHCFVGTVTDWYYHLSACLRDTEQLIKRNKVSTFLMMVNKMMKISIIGFYRNQKKIFMTWEFQNVQKLWY